MATIYIQNIEKNIPENLWEDREEWRLRLQKVQTYIYEKILDDNNNNNNCVYIYFLF